MKLEAKLGLSTGLLVLAMFLSAYTAHVRIQEANDLSSSIVTRRMPAVMALRDARLSLVEGIRTLESYLLFGIDQQSAADYQKQRANEWQVVDHALAELQKSVQTFDLGNDREKLNTIVSDLNSLCTLEDKVEQLNASHTPEGTTQAYDLLRNEIVTRHTKINIDLNQLIAEQVSQSNVEAEQLQRANHSVLLTLWLTTLFGAAIGGSLSMLLGRRIASAVNIVAQRANAIAAGDLTGKELDLHSNDQIGNLVVSMQQMQDNLGTIIGTVVQTAGTLTGNAASMRTASDRMHRRIDQQSQQTQQAASAMQEMSASIAEVSRHTQSAAETARNAAETARAGGTIVKEVLGNMHSIATAVSETSATVGLLGDDSRKISQIVTVIEEIARKTNLLALNAAIEAARAGDQGRGFAVVAGEVRRLAESTALATGEIASMIQGVQDRTRTAIASMASGTGTVEHGVVTTTQAGEALQRIIGMAEQVDRMITQIAIAANQQSVAANQSSSSLDSIHSLSHENLTEMATTAAGIESLRTTAAALEHQVDHFHLQTPISTSTQRATTRPAPHYSVPQPA